MLLRFDHSDVVINDYTLRYVQSYKKELVRRISNVFHNYGIGYFLANGNLLEYVRGEMIIPDDDVDFRFKYVWNYVFKCI